MKKIIWVLTITFLLLPVMATYGEGTNFGISGYIPTGTLWILNMDLPSSPNLSIEALLGFSTGSSSYSGYSYDMTSFSIGGGIKYTFKEWSKIKLYGGGRMALTIDSNGDTDLGFRLQPMLGPEYFITDHFSTSLEFSLPIHIRSDNSTATTNTDLKATIYF